MPTRLSRAIDRPIICYVWAIAAVVVSLMVRFAIMKVLNVELPAFLTFYPSVMLAALLAGFGSGLLATLLSSMIAAYWIFPPIGSFAIADKSNLVTLAFFAGTGAFLSLVAKQYRYAQAHLVIHREQQARREGDEELKRKEEQFEALANSIPQLCWMAEADGSIFWYNQGWYEYTGTTPEQMKGWGWQSVHSPDTLPKVLEKWTGSIAVGHPFEMVFPLKGRDGEFRSFLTRIVPVKDGAGRVVRWFGTNTDIDEQVRVAETLLSSNVRTQEALHRLEEAQRIGQIGDWDWALDTDAIRWSPQIFAILGRDPSLGQPTSHGAQTAYYDSASVPLISTKVAEAIATGETQQYELVVVRPDGTRVLTETMAVPRKDKDGRVVGLHGTLQDITERKRVEAALRESEGKLRKVIDGLGPYMFVGLMTLDGVLIEANRPALEAAGLTPGDVLGKPFADTYWWAYSEAVQEQLIAAIRGAVAGVPSRYEVQVQVAEGTLIWVDFSLFPVRDSDGEVIFLVPSATVIDERKKSEENIQKLSRTYAVLSDVNQTIVREKDSQALLDAACRIAVDKGKFQMAWIGMVDQASQQLRPVASYGNIDGYLDNVSIDLREGSHSDGPAVRCIITGLHSVCNDIEGDAAYLPWRDEALRRGYRSSAGLPLAVDGRVIGLLSLYASEPGFFDDQELVLFDEMAMDIGFALEVNGHEKERQKAEEELRWKTAFFEAQLESSLDGKLVVDDRGRIILKNNRVNELWQIPSEIAGKDYETQIQFVVSMTKNPEQFVEKMDYLYAHPDEVSHDEIELLDGKLLDRYSSPVKDKAGRYYGRIWIFHDITKRRRLEEQFRQSQKMEAVGQLTGGLAHDFNNLLCVIVGNLDLLESAVPDNEVALKRILAAQKASERGADLTRRLLSFSSSNAQLKPSPTDLHHSVRNMLELSGAIGRDLTFTTHFDDSIPPVLVDAAGFESALLNLVVNARDAMPANGGAITISTQVTRLEEDYPPVQTGELKAGRYACISVSDTGHGMSKTVQDRVFEPFFTTKPQGKGTGLGLAMVYGFVRQSGGSIRIYSELDVGTTVALYLPLAESSAQSVPVTVARPSLLAHGGKVLVVDDEPGLLEIAAAYLRWMGFTVYQAEDGASAMEVVRQHSGIDLLITDIIMPGGMNGVELAQKSRQLLPQIKIIYTSGFAANTLADRSLSLVDGDLLQKPYKRADFETAIRMALK